MVMVTVKDRYNTYTTNTVQGQRASSTQSAEMAACRLGAKLLGQAFNGVRQISRTDLPAHMTCWELLHA